MSAPSYPRHLSNRERNILKAFGKGRYASEMWKLRSENPHMPSGELYQAWDLGWLEDEEVYVAQSPHPGDPS